MFVKSYKCISLFRSPMGLFKDAPTKGKWLHLEICIILQLERGHFELANVRAEKNEM